MVVVKIEFDGETLEVKVDDIIQPGIRMVSLAPNPDGKSSCRIGQGNVLFLEMSGATYEIIIDIVPEEEGAVDFFFGTER